MLILNFGSGSGDSSAQDFSAKTIWIVDDDSVVLTVCCRAVFEQPVAQFFDVGKRR